MAEATPSHTPSPTPSKPATNAEQVILQSTRDSELQPDAFRGSEHLLKELLTNGDLVDLEAERRDEITKGKK